MTDYWCVVDGNMKQQQHEAILRRDVSNILRDMFKLKLNVAEATNKIIEITTKQKRG